MIIQWLKTQSQIAKDFEIHRTEFSPGHKASISIAYPPRSVVYYQLPGESAEPLELMKLIGNIKFPQT